MDDARSWTDRRDHRVWRVRTRWGGQAMGVGMDVDISKIPAHAATRSIEFIPADGQGPLYRTGMGEDDRDAEELAEDELERLLDEVRG